MKNLSQQIRTRYDQVQDIVEKSANSVGKNSNSIRLIVVTKTHPINSVLAALEAGIREFGENYAEEAVDKIQAIGDIVGLTWHMIGHIQSRKANLVACNFDFVHSIDSLKLAERLDRFAGEQNRSMPVLLECNVSGEESKFGFPVYETSQWKSFLAETEKIAIFPNLEIRGLMTMPPLFDDPEKTRPYFRRLRALRDYLAVHIPDRNWNDLSMGTSIDYPAAVEEGATFIRVGTAILGPRPAQG